MIVLINNNFTSFCVFSFKELSMLLVIFGSCWAHNLKSNMIVWLNTSYIVTTLECSNALTTPELSQFARVIDLSGNASDLEINQYGLGFGVRPVDD